MASFKREDIFDPDFLESLRHLRFVARRVPRGGRFAEQRSADLGGGTDFRDFRPYSPGDDFRLIDWNIYQRLGRVFLRLYEELEDLPVYFMTDVSRSLFLEAPPRVFTGLRATLALASIALKEHDSVGVFSFSDDAEVLVRPRGGKTRELHIADRLAIVQPGGATDFARAIERFGSFRLRRGLLIIVSDFFDPAGVESVVESLRSVRHELLLVQLARASDRDPALVGDVRLVDCETGREEEITVTSSVIERYRAAYSRFESALTDFASSRGSGLLRLDVERDLVAQLASLFEGGALRV